MGPAAPVITEPGRFVNGQPAFSATTYSGRSHPSLLRLLAHENPRPRGHQQYVLKCNEFLPKRIKIMVLRTKIPPFVVTKEQGPQPSCSLHVHDLDDGCIADPVQSDNGISRHAIFHVLGVLDGSGQDLIDGVSVRRPR